MNSNSGNKNRARWTDHRDIWKTDSIGLGDWTLVEVWEPGFSLGDYIGCRFY